MHYPPQCFVASPSKNANYSRIWGRDCVIIGLAALMTDDEELAAAFRETLLTLAAHQGPHGEIPSNVGLKDWVVSYGGTTGRIDADLWFVIGCGEYLQKTKGSRFLEKMMPVIDKIMFLLGAWEFNNSQQGQESISAQGGKFAYCVYRPCWPKGKVGVSDYRRAGKTF